MRNDFDTTWKVVLGRYCQQFFEFFFPPLAEQIDWGFAPERLDSELQRLAARSRQGRRHLDCLLKLRLKDGADLWVLAHIELQSQVDANFARRMITYHWRIRDHYDTDQVCSLAILGDTDPDWMPDRYESSSLSCRLSLEFPVCKLLAHPNWPQQPQNPFSWLVAAHNQANQTAGQPHKRLTVKLSLVRNLFGCGLKRQEVRDFFQMVDGILGLPDNLDQTFIQELATIEKESGMTRYISEQQRRRDRRSREAARAEGLAEGRAAGVAEGRAAGVAEGRAAGVAEGRAAGVAVGVTAGLVQGLRQALARQVQRRWGLDVSAQLEEVASIEQLEALQDSLLAVDSSQEWLQNFGRASQP